MTDDEFPFWICSLPMKIFSTSFLDRSIIILFFFLLILVPRPDLSFYVFLSVIVLEIFYIFRILTSKERWIFLFSLPALMFFLGYNSDLDYAIFKFNYHIYPVSIQDYFTLIVSFVFGMCCIRSNKKIFLFGCECFAYIALCSILADSILFKTHPPVFPNTNWSGSFIVSILSIAIQSSFFRLFASSSQTSRKTFELFKVFLIIPFLAILYIAVFYFLLQTGSRSAGIGFVLAFLLLLVYYLLKLKRESGCLDMLKRSRKLMISAIFVAIVIFYGLNNAVNLRYTTFVLRIGDLFDSSNQLRMNIYNCYLNIFKENIFFGSGIGHGAQLCERRLNLGLGDVNHGHNFILQIAANHGLFLTILIILLLVIYTSFSMRYFVFALKKKNGERDTMVVFSLTTLSMIFMSFLQLSIYHVPFLQIWTGLLAGGFVAIANQDLKAASSQKTPEKNIAS